jgi:hypothetical protein
VNVTSTQVQSLRASLPKQPTQKARILQCVETYGNVSRNDLAGYLNMRLSSVCASVNSLLKEKKLVVRGARWDNETQRNVEVLFANRDTSADEEPFGEDGPVEEGFHQCTPFNGGHNWTTPFRERLESVVRCNKCCKVVPAP